jgi:hypothetical protein
MILKVFNFSDIPDGCVLCDDVIEQKQQIASYTVFISYLCKGSGEISYMAFGVGLGFRV